LAGSLTAVIMFHPIENCSHNNKFLLECAGGAGEAGGVHPTSEKIPGD